IIEDSTCHGMLVIPAYFGQGNIMKRETPTFSRTNQHFGLARRRRGCDRSLRSLISSHQRYNQTPPRSDKGFELLQLLFMKCKLLRFHPETEDRDAGAVRKFRYLLQMARSRQQLINAFVERLRPERIRAKGRIG